MKMETKCNVCRKTKPPNDFLKNGKTLKSCVACRDKKTVKVPKPKEPEPKETKPVPEPVKPVPKNETKPLANTVAKPYIEYFRFVPMNPFISNGPEMFEPRWDSDLDVEYALFKPSHKYAYKEQLQKFIQQTSQSMTDRTIGYSQCGVITPSRNEMLKLYVTDNCPFINQTIISIKSYFEKHKHKLSFDTFVNTYPKHNIIFDAGISDYDKIQYIANAYDEIEKNINHMRR